MELSSKQLIEETKQLIISQVESQGEEKSYPLFEYTMCRLSLSDEFPTGLALGDIDPEDFVNFISTIIIATTEWYKDEFDKEHHHWHDLYSDFVEPFYEAINHTEIHMEDISIELRSILHAAIANTLRSCIESLSYKEILVWLDTDTGYNVIQPNESYAVLREHLGIQACDPFMLDQSMSSLDMDSFTDNPERVIADLQSSVSGIVDKWLETFNEPEYDAFRAEHKGLCDMLFSIGMMFITYIPTGVDLQSTFADHKKLTALIDYCYNNMLHGNIKESIMETGNERMCKAFLAFGIQLNIITNNKFGKGLLGADQGALYASTLDMELD